MMRKRTVYVHSRFTHISAWIQRVFYNGCSRKLEKFVRISGVHTGIRRSNRLGLTEELLMALWIVNNNKQIFYLLLLN